MRRLSASTMTLKCSLIGPAADVLRSDRASM
jgi:hypothetical protein